MDNAHWFVLTGGLLLFIGVTSSILRRLPVSTSFLYLAVGLLVGPTGLNLFHFNPLKQSEFLEALTEVAVLISLFSAGVKMPVPVRLWRWRMPILLASVSMVVSVALIALFAYFVLHLSAGAAILLGAIVAPTDPVLATDVQSRHPGDHDKLRFALTCEAGMNDGSAFPFVVLGMGLLGLHKIGFMGWRWLFLDVVWATLGGIMIGCIAGYGFGRLISTVHKKYRQGLLDDFLGLGLIGMVYGISEICHAWGFLAVFFAAVALRQAEFRAAIASGEQVIQEVGEEPADGEKSSRQREFASFVSSSSLVFNDYLERLSELVLILLVGGTLFVHSWSVRAVGLALFLFFIARPLSVYIGLLPIRGVRRVKGLSAWFGVRGIGSLYYLMYAIDKGLAEPLALELIHLTLIVITLSILLHGITVRPLLHRFWQ